MVDANNDETKSTLFSTAMDRLRSFPSTVTIAEISGSFGDMATLLPILLALGKTGQISVTSSLFFGGLYNVFTGLYYDIPMCVQPMKAIAATAVASNMSQQQITSAGMFVSAVLLFLGVTRLINVVNKYIPLTIVRGIQLGAGITLVMKGAQSILKAKLYDFTGDSLTDNIVTAILAFSLVVAFYRSKVNPAALIIFFVGIIIAVVRLYVHGGHQPTLNTSFPPPIAPTPSEFATGVLMAGLGQLPLSLLNSVIAVSKLANDLYPNKSRPVASVTSVAVSVGFMNLIGGWFGSTPYCHGAGGLAAQYRFGARTGTSIVMLGILKIIIGLTFGNSLVAIFQYIPNTFLGVMLAVAGLELASCARDVHVYTPIEEYQDNFIILLITAGGLIGFSNDGVGFALGCLAALILGASRARNAQSIPLTNDTQ
ncbi:hypothetical protein BASA50_009732 [Batrachochytrium salamandrivorans]|uniref:SLC26A/SulP transporter domain-containing protein n=1 Tax=Batrachochytrium salamandrivorans TaxID=1357716 RepID=A0ABQ8F0R3_9FUNG|nr:hypothetical protein BASA62_004659 [Batrachochytrium salamandrivorans]KAH6590030.1 hypothetical protein BASA50_009732 [Batrachochytrium salamandrivorans]KAH9252627.1 hypothetical protein BASA81_009407 [Batrachochytrium salamandrivorans]KAH9270123.1 hypothetical protein BASA83_007798 [Batrachochytrium salamandrivorans]